MPPASTKQPGQDALVHEIHEVNQTLRHQNKLLTKFLHGISLGLGSAIGASIIAAIVIIILTRILRAIGLESVLETLNQYRR